MQKRKVPSIICNDCVGGIIYHGLGMRFASPTVNLTVGNYFMFIENLKEYLSLPVEQIFPKEKRFFKIGPFKKYFTTGVIRGSKGDVEINFVHYPSFEKGKEAWEKRAKRVDFDEIYVILHWGWVNPKYLEHAKNGAAAFARLEPLGYQIKKKALLIGEPLTGADCEYVIPFYDGKKRHATRIYKRQFFLFGKHNILRKFDYKKFICEDCVKDEMS